MTNTTTTDRRSPVLVLAGEVIGQDVQGWVAERRELGQSWRRIAQDLTTACQGKCQISRELLRRHFGDIVRGH